jgi:hypothetical protein
MLTPGNPSSINSLAVSSAPFGVPLRNVTTPSGVSAVIVYGIARKGGMQLGRSRAEAFDIESDVDLPRLLEGKGG